MNKKQLEETEGFVLHDKPTEALSDAIDRCLNRAVKRLDKMFLLVCEARAAYISSSKYHKEEDYVKSYNNRRIGSDKLTELQNLLLDDFSEDK